MFSSRRLTINYVPLFCILVLLQCISSYVAQLPNKEARPLQISSSATHNNSLATSLTSTPASLSQEEPPQNFWVQVQLKAHATSYGLFNFLNSMIWDMAEVAIKEWDSILPAYKFATTFHVAIGFVGSRGGPGLRVKHIIWALERIFDIVLKGDRYLSSNVVVALGPVALALGNVYYAPPKSAPVKSPDMPLGEFADATTESLVPSSKWDPSNDTKSNSALLASRAGKFNLINPHPLSQGLVASTHLNASGPMRLELLYRPNGAQLDITQVYNASLKLLIKAAEPSDDGSTIWPGISTYNDINNFTYTLRPNNFDIRDEVTWLDSISIVTSISSTMFTTGGVPGKFAELDGVITVNHKIIVGRFCIDKGDKTGLNLEDVCNVEVRESRFGEDAVATL